MRPLFLAAILSCTLLTNVQSQATNYGAVEWDIARIGYAIPSLEGLSGGVLLGTEARYNFTNQISGSLRIEFAIYGTDVITENFDIGLAASYALFGDYYFDDEMPTRFFGGLGLGVFSGGRITINGEEESMADSAIGLVPRFGVEIGHFRLALEYNAAFSDAVSNYVGLTFAGTIGGGLRNYDLNSMKLFGSPR
ncbi:MAG: hypothetical protein AAFY36_13290 [Bacteroidota bacterium]